MIGIYKIVSPSGKIYIGQSVNIKQRISFYKNYKCEKQRKLYSSLKKYGWDNHKFEILCLCEISKLNNLEKHYINLYKTFDTVHGLNLMSGGDGCRHSKETILKFKNRIVSDKTKKILSESRKGKVGNRKGYINKNEHNEKISKTRIERKIKVWNDGIKRPEFSDNWKYNMSKSHIGLKHTEDQKKKHKEGLLKWWAERKAKNG